MNKYFNYKRATLWWEEVKTVRGVNEQNITWENFQRYFKERYLTEQFYDKKAKEFHVLRLGQMTMDEFITKFTSLLRYVPYIREEKAKMHRFIGSLPLFMKEHLEFDNSKTMDEVIRKARICYQQSRQNGDMGKIWNDKKGIKFPTGGKGNKYVMNKGPHKGQIIKNQNRNPTRFKLPNESKTNEQSGRTEVELAARPPVQCWGCGGPHYVKN